MTTEPLIDRLCDLHSRLTLCWDQGPGKPLRRRPSFFTPQWQDMETVLDAAVQLQRRHTRITTKGDTGDD